LLAHALHPPPRSPNARHCPAQVEVTWEDQNRINRFGRLNGRLQEVKGDVERLEVRFPAHSARVLDAAREARTDTTAWAAQKEHQNIEDGLSEVQTQLDDDACMCAQPHASRRFACGVSTALLVCVPLAQAARGRGVRGGFERGGRG
jgi:hypothetical protein